MNDFNYIKDYYKHTALPTEINLTPSMIKIIISYMELNQLADWKERYSEMPEGKSDEWINNYNYNKDLDTKRTNFNEKGLKCQMAEGLVQLVWGLLTKAIIERGKDVNFVEFNKLLKDLTLSKVNKSPNVSMTFGALKSFFTVHNEFIPKSISDIIIEQILPIIMNLASQFDLNFEKQWNQFCEWKENEKDNSNR